MIVVGTVSSYSYCCHLIFISCLIAIMIAIIFPFDRNIDDVDKTMDEINEQTENMKQIQEALSAPIGAAADFDEVIDLLMFLQICIGSSRCQERKHVLFSLWNH